MLLSSVTLLADFSYDQTSKITGGMMAGMMKMAGTFSKAAREPMASSVYVKGDRMAHVNARRTQVIDLKAQTITEIDLDKKTYSVMTFEQMKQMMEQMSQKMADKKAENPDAQFKFKVSVKDTGVKKNVNGFDTKEAIMTLQMEGKDQKSGQTGDLSIVNRGPGWAFGFGGAILTDPAAVLTPQSPGTFGWGGVWGHSWFTDPFRRLTVVSLTNTALEGMMGRYIRDVRDAVYADLG